MSLDLEALGGLILLIVLIFMVLGFLWFFSLPVNLASVIRTSDEPRSASRDSRNNLRIASREQLPSQGARAKFGGP